MMPGSRARTSTASRSISARRSASTTTASPRPSDLDIRYVNQSWLHGRFVTNALQHAALAVSAGLADVVACVTAVSFTRERGFLGGPGDVEGNREEGGTHGEAPPYGLTAPAGGAAIAMQRYMHLYGATSAQLAAVPISIRQHALNNPRAIMQQPLTLGGAPDGAHGGRSAAAVRLLPDQRRRRDRAGDARAIARAT